MKALLLGELKLVVDELSELFGPEQCTRLRLNLDALVAGRPPAPSSRWQKPRLFFFEGLPEQPWYEAQDYPELARVAAQLEAAAPQLRAEYDRAASGVQPVRYASSDVHRLEGDDWSGFTIWDRGQFTPIARSFPETSAVIRALSDELYLPSGEVVFLRLRAGARVPAHHDATNAQLTCHLGISVPEGCGIRVGGETRGWQDGRVLFFDHSFEHEVWNQSNQDRVVLLLNLVHPALTPAERALLRAVTANDPDNDPFGN